jgi:alkylation response protein AidB-like acyl-CoA dehydrogenase
MQQLSSDQNILRDSVRRFLARNYDFQKRQSIVMSEAGFDRNLWAEMAQLGWTSLGFPSRFGGLEAKIADLVLLATEFGRSLVVEPYLSTLLLGARALVNAKSDAHCATLLPDVMAGHLHLALAYAEPASGHRLHVVDTAAVATANGYRLDGTKAVVLGAPYADVFIVAARTSGARDEAGGITLFSAPKDKPGLSLRAYQTIDGRRAGDVHLNGVVLRTEDVVGPVGGGHDILSETILAASLVQLGEALGAMEGAIERTVDYLKTRRQFGQPLASFQALRHRIADMIATNEETAALVRRAVRVYDHEVSGDPWEELAAAKAFVSHGGLFVCKESVQLHGAIAIADEYIVGHYLKRLVAIDRLFGNMDAQVDAFLERFWRKP